MFDFDEGSFAYWRKETPWIVNIQDSHVVNQEVSGAQFGGLKNSSQ
jgi:hypothetical protein